MAILVHESGRVIHYNEPKRIHKNSLDNLEVVRNKEKSFALKGKHKRLIQSSAVRMWKEKEPNEMLHFGTVTFSDDVPNEEKIRQEIYKKFVKNMTANHGMTGYIAVKEKGEKNGRIHYHIIMRMPFVKYSLINKCLHEIHKNFGYRGSNNLFSTNSRRGRHVIKNVDHVVKYVTKYVSKSDGVFKEKCYFISKSVQSSPIKVESLGIQYELFENFPVKEKFLCEQCAITTHDRLIFDALNSM